MKKITVKVDTKLSNLLEKDPLDVIVFKYLKKHGAKSHSQLESELNILHPSMYSAIKRLLINNQVKQHLCNGCSTTRLVSIK